MKTLHSLPAVILVVCIVLCMTACGQKDAYPEGYDLHVNQIGLPKNEVLDNLKLQESDLSEVEFALYKVPGTFSFAGFDFDLCLLIDMVNNYVYGFEYRTTASDAKSILALQDALTSLYGDPYKQSISEESLRKFETADEHVSSVWALQTYAKEDLPRYDALWESQFADLWHLILFLEVRSAESEDLLVTMRYYVAIK